MASMMRTHAAMNILMPNRERCRGGRGFSGMYSCDLRKMLGEGSWSSMAMRRRRRTQITSREGLMTSECIHQRGEAVNGDQVKQSLTGRGNGCDYKRRSQTVPYAVNAALAAVYLFIRSL